jgi:DNA-directed RNA polymerase subunit N (RpoN/RPB10)
MPSNPVDDEAPTDRSRRCSSCGAHVSHDFARVFGDNGNNVENCLSCSTTRELGQSEADELGLFQ